MNEQSSRRLLILSILAVLFSSWAAGNLMDINTDGAMEPMLDPDPEVIMLSIPLILLSIIFAYAYYVLYDKDRISMVSGILLLLFWIFSFLGAMLFFIYPAGYVAFRVGWIYSIPFDITLPSYLPDLGFLILLSLIGFFFAYGVFLKLATGKNRTNDTEIDARDREEVLVETEEDIEDSLSSTLDRAIVGLSDGEDVRSTIINCYREMSQILEESGAKNDKFLTPREFKDESIENISAPRNIISEITYLFEEARYSPHKLGEDKRKRALRQLKRLKEGMK